MHLPSKLAKVTRAILDETPRRNLAKLQHKLAVGAPRPENSVLGSVLESPGLPFVMAHAIGRLSSPVVLAGEGETFERVASALRARGVAFEARAFGWNDRDLLSQNSGAVLLCLVPLTAEQWERVAELKRSVGAKLYTLSELLLPYTCLPFLQRSLSYYFKTQEEILPFYMGVDLFGPFKELDHHFPIRGKAVIEFGPFDGCQTAGLMHCGASRVTCIEARAENAIKTRAAAELLGWDNVRVVMDDFHNADASKYGRHDLAFAHGVYYHAVAPFLFLENLCSLSDAVFVGGFCATDELPRSPWIRLENGGNSYRAKAYHETRDFTAGVNSLAYFFHGDDLQRFFVKRGYRVEIISDEPSSVTAGKFLRFIALR